MYCLKICVDCWQAGVTFWATRVPYWVQGGSAGEQWGCELPECCNTVLGERYGSLYPTAATRWCSAMPSVCAPTQHPTLCSSEELGPTPDMKPGGKGGAWITMTQWKHMERFNTSVTKKYPFMNSRGVLTKPTTPFKSLNANISL